MPSWYECEVCEHVMGRAEEATLCEEPGHEWQGKILCMDCFLSVMFVSNSIHNRNDS